MTTKYQHMRMGIYATTETRICKDIQINDSVFVYGDGVILTESRIFWMREGKHQFDNKEPADTVTIQNTIYERVRHA